MGRDVFISGGTGYLGAALIPRLLSSGHNVHALARPASHRRLPPGSRIVVGNALDASTFREYVQGCDTFIHLVGTPHPAPWKGEQFRAVDRVSFQASLEAAAAARVAHFIYVSVAHPAPVMHAYIDVRTACERDLRGSGLRVTVLRPWYVLGPGHWWPLLLLPAYAAAERVPGLAAGASRLGLVWRAEMVAALHWAVDSPPEGWRVLDVPAIRDLGRLTAGSQRADDGAASPDPADRPDAASATRATAPASGRHGA